MKKEKSSNSVILISRIALISMIFLISSISAYSTEIAFMMGDVKVLREGKAIEADMGTKLESGDFVKTGSGAMADLSYEDGSIIRVQENSRIKVGSKSVKGSDSVSVVSGIVKGKFSKLSRGSARKVYSPTTVCSVRGTEFLVAVSESADTKVKMNEGKLDVHNPYGKVKLKGNQNADIGVAKGPDKKRGMDISLEEWQKKSNEDLDQNPEVKSKSFNIYIKTFNKRSKGASKNIDKLKRKQSTAAMKGKRGLEKANQEIEGVEEEVEDDMYLSAAANNSIDGILNRFQQDKKSMYDTFLRIKKESNRVLEQQRRNYEAIMAVKEAYRKAYEEIMKKHKEAMEGIKGSFDKEGVKPKIK